MSNPTSKSVQEPQSQQGTRKQLPGGARDGRPEQQEDSKLSELWQAVEANVVDLQPLLEQANLSAPPAVSCS